MDLLSSKEEVNIITIVRDPISRNISSLFQAFEFMKEGKYKTEFNIREFDKLFYAKVDHQAPEKWFDYELKNNFGIDIYNYEFDIRKKHLVIKEGNLKLLIIRLEDFKELEKVMADFLCINNFELINKNVSEVKWYSEVYESFKRNFKPSKEYLDKYLNTKFTKHFYSEAEINKIYKKYL